LTRKKIMIVDDDKEFLEELEETLILSGYAAVAINDSTTALNAARRAKPDLIILDLKMDVMDGFQVAKSLKQSPETATIPIVAMTGYFTREEYSSLTTMYGMETCIMKPFNPLDMIAKIENLLVNELERENQAE